jgi:hypothetical protein
MSTVIINGKTYVGNSISVTNGKVIVDGKNVTPESKEINIKVEGNIQELKVDACDKIEVAGNVSNIHTQSGDVEVTGDVTGNIQTMSGDVDCANVGGSISSMSGDIKHRRS